MAQLPGMPNSLLPVISKWDDFLQPQRSNLHIADGAGWSGPKQPSTNELHQPGAAKRDVLLASLEPGPVPLEPPMGTLSSPSGKPASTSEHTLIEIGAETYRNPG